MEPLAFFFVDITKGVVVVGGQLFRTIKRMTTSQRVEAQNTFTWRLNRLTSLREIDNHALPVMPAGWTESPQSVDDVRRKVAGLLKLLKLIRMAHATFNYPIYIYKSYISAKPVLIIYVALLNGDFLLQVQRLQQRLQRLRHASLNLVQGWHRIML